MELKLITPSFDSELTDLIITLDYLRKKELSGTTHPKVFFQLKRIFHTLESIGSARIEGNNTTVAEYLETKIEKEDKLTQDVLEIQNIERTMDFVEETITDYPINRIFVSELHKNVVSDLMPPPKGEGDKTPGEYRTHNVKIAQSSHKPLDATLVSAYMDELFTFINKEDSPKYDLLKVAIAHHRLVWIHPFGNGNGRTVRLFTYAMLVKAGFNVNVGRILNPTAVFCSNREEYYNQLQQADLGTAEGIENWCIYVLKGLKDEIEKIDNLLDYEYLKGEVLLPSLKYALDKKYVTPIEFQVLKKVVEKQQIQASDLKDVFKGKSSAEISRQIKRLVEKQMLVPEEEGKRKYIIRFDNNYLLRGVMHQLGEKGFLPNDNI